MEKQREPLTHFISGLVLTFCIGTQNSLLYGTKSPGADLKLETALTSYADVPKLK